MTPATGTTPKGITGEEAASRWVRGMFGRVAGRYDLLNHLLSFNLDKRWRARMVERVADVLARPDAKVLDLCCGTGDVLLSLAARRAGVTIFGSDFCHPMLMEAQRKVAARKLRSPLFEADALALPLAILEFSQPTNRAFAGLYGFFSMRVLPWVGGMISGSRDAYSYLPESIKKFPGAEGLAEQMQAAGFRNVEFERLTLGAVALHLGRR